MLLRGHVSPTPMPAHPRPSSAHAVEKVPRLAPLPPLMQGPPSPQISPCLGRHSPLLSIYNSPFRPHLAQLSALYQSGRKRRQRQWIPEFERRRCGWGVCAVFIRRYWWWGFQASQGGQKGAFGDRDSGKEPTHRTASPLEASQRWLSAALGSEFQVSALLPAC